MGDTQNSRRPRESGDPAAFVPTTPDSLPAFAGTKGRGNDDIKNPDVTHFRNA
jgi:hypothetical protein